MIEVCKNLRTIYQGSRSSWEDQEDQEDHDLLVVESPPQLRTIKVKWPDIEMRPIQKRTFYLSFPYMQFYLWRGSLHLSFSKKPVQCLEQDEICFPFLPNVYSKKLRVCLSLENNDIEQAVELFWNTGFYVWTSWYGCWLVPAAIRKNDLGSFAQYQDETLDDNFFCGEAIKQFEVWEEGTRKEGVDFISNLEWPHAFKDLPYILAIKEDFSKTIVDMNALAIFRYGNR